LVWRNSRKILGMRAMSPLASRGCGPGPLVCLELYKANRKMMISFTLRLVILLCFLTLIHLPEAKPQKEVKRVVTTCSTCAELKPQFIKKDGQLIKALRPFERLNIDFKGPLPQTQSGKRYILTVVDEFSRFPFAFPCADMDASTVCNHLNDLFSVFGTPAYIHSDQGTTFMSTELKSFLQDRGIATSRTTPYNPQGNGQCERYNGVIWKAVQLALRTHGLTKNQWEIVLQDALHSVRSLLCTATNATPHERMFLHPRRSSNGYSIPSWLSSGNKAYMKRHVRASKFDPYVDEVELLEVNPDYAHVRLADGREATVSVKHLAPTGNPTEPIPNSTTQPETEDTSVSQNQINSSPRHHANSTNNLPLPFSTIPVRVYLQEEKEQRITYKPLPYYIACTGIAQSGSQPFLLPVPSESRRVLFSSASNFQRNSSQTHLFLIGGYASRNYAGTATLIWQEASLNQLLWIPRIEHSSYTTSKKEAKEPFETNFWCAVWANLSTSPPLLPLSITRSIKAEWAHSTSRAPFADVTGKFSNPSSILSSPEKENRLERYECRRERSGKHLAALL
ncbi:unnamed protein product, partial [Nesidiocoris tenuis]